MYKIRYTLASLSIVVAWSLSGCGFLLHPPSAANSSSFPAIAVSPPFVTTADFLTTNTGFIGVNSSLMATTNGGASWTLKLFPHQESAVAIDFLNPAMGWVLAQGGNGYDPLLSLLKTTNGGQSWVIERTFKTAQGGSLMMTSTKGYAVVAHHLYMTSIYSNTWTPVALPAGDRPQAMDFLTGQQGWVAVQKGSQYQLLYTSNGAQSFHPVFQSPNPVVSIDFSSTLHGRILIGQKQSGMGFGPLEETRNSGKTWTQVISANGLMHQGAAGYPIGMEFQGAHDGWIGTTSGAQGFLSSGLLVTTDGGSHWTPVGSKQRWILRAQSMTLPGMGWVLGDRNVPFVARTTDNGKHWSQIWPNIMPLAVDFVSSSVGYGLGTASNPNAVLMTQNGGQSWTVQNAQPPAQFTNISFGGATGLAIADTYASDGRTIVQIFRTTNGGVTWRLLSSRPTPLSIDITMLSTKEALLQTARHVYASTDGGLHWKILSNIPQSKVTTSTDYLSLHQKWTFDSASAWGANARLVWHDGTKRTTVFTWPASPKTLYIQPTTLDFLNRHTGWILLQKMARSDKTFTKPGSTKKFFKVNSVNQLYHTTNGGRTWTLAPLPSTLSPKTLDFVNSHAGYLYTNNALLHTINSGRSWTLIKTSSYPNIP